MPGLHLVFKNGISKDEVARVSDDLKHKDEITVSEWIRNDNTLVLFSLYDGYPCSFIDKKDFLIIVEGMIYDRADSEVGKSLSVIAGDFLAGNDYKEGIKDFISKSDGDFLVLILFKKKYEAIIFNDRWGRLPAFYSIANEFIAFSREIKFILQWTSAIELNIPVLAQFLVFEYNLGDETPIKNIKRLKPASILKLEISRMKGEVDTLYPVDFTLQLHGYSRTEMIDNCLELFNQSLDCRISKLNELEYRLTADLSGGYDTRAVVAALANHDAEFRACTDNPATGDETPIAEKVARQLGVELLAFDAVHTMDNIKELARLTYVTDGLINCFTTLTCFYDDLEREKTLRGRQANFMGFGGEFIRHPLKPKSGYKGLFEMLSDDAFSSFLKISDACSILGLDRKKFMTYLQAEVDQFPEEDIPDKMKHLFFELHDKQVKGGEDRHRLFRWTVQPLWGTYLFDYEMHNIPLELIDDDLFIDFMAGIDIRMLDIPLQGHQLTLDSGSGRSILMLERKIKRVIRDNRRLSKISESLVRLRNQSKYPRKSWHVLAEATLNMLMSDRFFASAMNFEQVVKFIRECRDGRQFYQVLTVILYIRELKKRFGDKIKISQ